MKTLKEVLKEMPDGHWLFINAPNIKYTMTGTKRAGIKSDGTICIQYTDGELQEKPCNGTILEMDAENIDLLKLVSYVQEVN